MYKLRLSDNDYQAVQLETGHNTPVVLMAHYNEIMDVERTSLAEKLEKDFYTSQEAKETIPDSSIEELLQAVMADPIKMKILSKMMSMQSVQI